MPVMCRARGDNSCFMHTRVVDKAHDYNQAQIWSKPAKLTKTGWATVMLLLIPSVSLDLDDSCLRCVTFQ